MVGRCLGEGDIERPERMSAQLIKITVPVNFLISLSVILLSRPLLGMFTSDELVFRMAIGIFFVDMIAELARAVSQVYEYALRAVGDIMFTTGVLAVSCAVFSLALAYVLAIPCGLGLIGCWIGLALDEVTRAIVTYFRWRRGIWKTKKI
jgi:Na+-driven multidrug efflux pump